MGEKLNEEEIKWLYRTLRGIDFFSTVSMEDIEKIISRFFKQTFTAGKVIIKPGIQGDALYIIKSGVCEVYIRKGLFKEVKFATLKEGSFFGEMSLILNEPTIASVKTTEPTEVFVFLKSDFLKLLSENKSLESQIRYIAEKRKFDNLNR